MQLDQEIVQSSQESACSRMAVQRVCEPRPSGSGPHSQLDTSAKGSRPVELAVVILRFYKRWLSPLLPSACRFHPTCSEYTMDAIQRYGVLRGIWLGVRRLLRCHPFHEGGFDPVR